jgi:hypothetical protein
MSSKSETAWNDVMTVNNALQLEDGTRNEEGFNPDGIQR